MKLRILLTLGIIFLPALLQANEIVPLCSEVGYSVATINGIFTSEREAQDNKDALGQFLGKNFNKQPLKLDYLHNPSHLAGVGDILKAIQQKVFDSETVGDYDLGEIHKAASKKVGTQKLLLVAHSQGNFYANGLYDTLADKSGGVPAMSLGVYGVATPSGRVAGNGKWYTSASDKVIAGVVGSVPFRAIMKPNAEIALAPGDDKLGHSFANVYLKYRATEIVRDIYATLDRLQPNSVQTATKPCITPPTLSVKHKATGVVLAVADPLARGIRFLLSSSASALYRSNASFAMLLRSALAQVANLFATTKEQPAAVAAAIVSTPPPVATSDLPPPTQPEPAPLPITVTLVRSAPPSATEPAQVQVSFSPPAPPVILPSVPAPSFAPAPVPVPAPVQAPVVISVNSNEYQPGFGAGGGGGGGAVVVVEEVVPEPEPADTSAPAAPVVTSPATTLFATTTITFTGTAEAASVISNTMTTATTSVDRSGAWSLELVFAQGTTTIGFLSADAAGNVSATTSMELTIDSVAPGAPVITAPASFAAPFASGDITFTGTAEASSTIATSFSLATTTADAAGAWTFALTFPLGETTVGFAATDAMGNSSATTTVTLTVAAPDTTAPDIALTIPECASSLATDTCLLATSTLAVAWSTAATDIAEYTLLTADNGATTTATTTVTSYSLSAENGHTYSVQVVAVDTAGNRATSTIVSAEVNMQPLVINEIAWAGTAASSFDEWIELKNLTTHTLSLANIVLEAADSTPSVVLSGTMAANGYYLLERRDDDTTSAVADLVYGTGAADWALANDGEQLQILLRVAGAEDIILDRTPEIAVCGGWCAGNSNPDYQTMQRMDDGTYDNYMLETGDARDRDSGDILGTPGAENDFTFIFPEAE